MTREAHARAQRGPSDRTAGTIGRDQPASAADKRSTRSRRSAGTIGAAAVLVAIAGCSGNPFKSSPLDYEHRVSTDRVRSIAQLQRDAYRAPEPAATVNADGDSTEIDHPDDRLIGRESVELSLEEARASALENNLDLRVSLINPILANERVSEEEARFNGVFNLTASWNEGDEVVFSSLESGQSRAQFVQPEVVVPMRTGGNVSVRLPTSFVQTDNVLTSVLKSRSTDLEFSISHPLLRGAGRRANTFGLRIADINRQISESQTKLSIITQISSVDRAYWSLYAVREALVVRQQQLELAQEQLDRAVRLNNAGRTPEIEVIRAQAGVASRLEGIIIAQNAVLTGQRELKRRMNMPGLDVDTATLVQPNSTPDPVQYEYDPDALVEVAQAQRMELLELELQLLSDRNTIELRQNEALWELGVNATYSINGRGTTLGQSFGTLEDNRFTNWSIGARASVPIGNQERESRLQQAMIQRLQRLTSRESRTQLITQEVFDSVDRIAADWQRIMAAQQSVVLNTRALDAERRQFDVGRSTTTDVLDADTRLAEARLTEIQAIADYQISQVNLAVATGTLLGAARVDWEPFDPRDADLNDTTSAAAN